LRFARFASSRTLLQSQKAVEAVGTAEVVGMAEVVVGTAEVVATGAVAFMDLLLMVAAGTLVMGGVAMLTAFRRTPTTDMDLLVTP